MTREEQTISNLKKLKSFHNGSYGTDIDRAIKALEQEPTVAQERYEDLCEYFGGAKDILNNREDFKAWLGRVKWHIHKAEELYEKYEQEPCEDAISRQAVLKTLDDMDNVLDEDRTIENYKELLKECYEVLPSVNPQPKTGYISIDDVMSVFDDFMCGEVDEDGTDTFLKMLKDRAEAR